jgi:hypothetical protein
MEDAPTEEERRGVTRRVLDVSRGRSVLDLDADGRVDDNERRQVERLARLGVLVVAMLLLAVLFMGGFIATVELDVLNGTLSIGSTEEE